MKEHGAREIGADVDAIAGAPSQSLDKLTILYAHPSHHSGHAWTSTARTLQQVVVVKCVHHGVSVPVSESFAGRWGERNCVATASVLFLRVVIGHVDFTTYFKQSYRHKHVKFRPAKIHGKPSG